MTAPFLTILTCIGEHSAAKRFTPSGVKSFDLSYWMHWREVTFQDFDAMAKTLDDLTRRQASVVVLGRVVEAERQRGAIRRRKKPDPKTGDPAFLEDAGSRVLHFDIDDLPMPAGHGWHDPAAAARAVWGMIGERQPAFRGVSAFWQASNSAGTAAKRGLAKLHLWALTDTPIDEPTRRVLLKELAAVNLADSAVASINQPNYTAAPIFEGVPDPLAAVGRSGTIRGARDFAPVAELRLPSPEVAKERAKRAPRNVTAPEIVSASETTPHGWRILERACAKIEGLPSGGRNVAINRQAYAVGGHVGAGRIAYNDALHALLDAGERSGHLRYQEAVTNGLRDGINNPFDPDPTPRDPSGRFTGNGLTPFTGSVPQTSNPLPIREARQRIGSSLRGAFEKALAWDREGDEPAPVHVEKGDPGGGKSTMARELVRDYLDASGMDADYYAPTLGLAEEAAAHARRLGIPSVAIRGRTAISEDGETPMCARAGDVKRAMDAGCKSIGHTFCKTTDEQGQERLCPWYRECPWQRQLKDLPPHPVARFKAHNYLTLPEMEEGRTLGLRIIDEKFWQGLGRQAAIPLDALFRNRPLGLRGASSKERANRNSIIADLLECARGIDLHLRKGGSVIEAVADYTPEELREFAKAERWAGEGLPIWPDSSQHEINAALKEAGGQDRHGGALAAMWSELARAREEGIGDLQSVAFVPDYKPQKRSEPRATIFVFWHKAPPRDVPVIALDADAKPEIYERIYPGAELAQTRLSPNIHMVQITDRTFSKSALMGSRAMRDELRQVIEVERRRDAGGGMLIGATRAVVKAFFEDAGHDFTDMEEDACNKVMRETRLHGAAWLWFGPGALGLNDWKDFTTVFVLGREEWPVAAIQNEARKLQSRGLHLIDTSGPDRGNMPEVERPFVMADGRTFTVKVRCHPDPLCRAIQESAREDTTRQLVERLRLASAATPKRVIMACNVPVPGLPANEALTWAEYMPDRATLAFSEAGGALRITGKGLAEDAPRAFSTAKAAEKWLEREDMEARLFTPHTPYNISIGGMGGKSRVLVAFKIAGVRGRHKTRAVIEGTPAEAERIARDKWGDLRDFEVLRHASPPPVPRGAPPEKQAKADIPPADPGRDRLPIYPPLGPDKMPDPPPPRLARAGPG